MWTLVSLVTLTWGQPCHAMKGFVDVGYGNGLLLDATDVVNTTDSLGIALVPFASVGIELGKAKAKVHPQLSLQYRVFSPANSSGIYSSIQTVTPMLGLAIGKFTIGLGATPLVSTQSGTNALPFVTGYTLRSDFLSARVEFGYDYPITPEFSITGSLGSQLLMSSVDQSLSGQAIDGTIAFRFWIGGIKTAAAKKRGYYGEEEDDYKGWRYPFGQGM